MNLEDVIIRGLIVMFIVLCISKESISSFDTVCKVRINAPAEQIELIEEELSLLPDSIYEEFIGSDVEVSVVQNLPEQYSGSCSYSEKNKYKIKLQEGYVEDAFLHEVGHWFYHINNLEDVDNLNILIQRYGSEVLLNELENNEYYCKYSEFFAEIFSMYLHNKLESEEFNEYFNIILGVSIMPQPNQ